MPRLFTILLSLLPVLFASGEAVTAVRELGANDVRTCLRHVSPAEGGNVSISGGKAAPRQHRKAMSVHYYCLYRPTTVSLGHGGASGKAKIHYDDTARHTLPQIFNTFRTMDPCAEKFYWLSPYSFCGGDPINFIDPSGNRMVVVEDGVEYEYREFEGEYGFYNSDNQIYAGGSDFVGKLDEALQKIISGDVGKIIVDGLIDMDQTIKLECVNDENAGNEYYNNSNIVKWNPQNDQGGISMNDQGEYTSERPAFIGLAHELAHGYDQNILGGTDRRVWSKDSKQSVRRSDIFAGNIENFIRMEHGIAPRVAYTNNINSFNMATTRYNIPMSWSIKPTKNNISLWKY